MTDEQKLAQVAPQANMQAAFLVSNLLTHELAQKLAANTVLAQELQLALSTQAALRGACDTAEEKARKANAGCATAEAKLAVVHDALFEMFGRPGEKHASLEMLLDRARAAERAAQHATDDNSVDWGVIQRLRAVMGHLRGNRVPSAMGLLDSVIDELTSMVQEPEPPNADADEERALAAATAADRKIKEDKEGEPPM